ncbi:flagellar protein FlaG [Robertmurraya massiliosenegalensis]|uniref:flagellar protein FlaG n=1 Tax=Robertmurraya TaxID=2837507 RepID=UPI0039A637DA
MDIGGLSKSMLTSSFTPSVGKEERAIQKSKQVKPIEQHQDKPQKEVKEEHKGKLSKEETEHIVKGMNEFLHPKYTSVTFKLHEELDRYYVEVIDKETKEVVREVPTKEILDMYAKMTEYLGLFIDEKL